jgi:hypothetical protein
MAQKPNTAIGKPITTIVMPPLLGAGILTASLGAVLKANFLQAISDGLWVLMGLIFFCAWGLGLILAIRQPG